MREREREREREGGRGERERERQTDSEFEQNFTLAGSIILLLQARTVSMKNRM